MGTSFIQRLKKAQEAKGTALCVGLDPDLARIPQHLTENRTDLEAVERFCMEIIDQTSKYACAYKLNFAFFEVLGAGSWALIKRVVEHIPNDCVTIADAKRGDIGNTAKMYAAAAFDTLAFDSCTVSPYLGFDSVSPFLAYPNKCAFLLTLTSNPGSNDFQRLEVGGTTLYNRVADSGAKWSLQMPGTLGFVVGGTHANELARLRKRYPSITFLIPGVGAQGASPEEVMQAASTAEGLVIVNSSRSILFASDDTDFASAAGRQAKRLAASLSIDI